MYEFTGKRELFLASIEYLDHSNQRPSAVNDANSIREALERLRFVCPEENQLIGYVSSNQIRQGINQFVANGRLRQSDMVAVCLMTHGTMGRNGQLLQFSDGQNISLAELLAPVLECRELIGRPKIIIIQACRGDFNSDQGMMADNPTVDRERGRLYHSTRDKFIFYSSSPGNLSWCHPTRGSVFIEHLTRALNEYGHTSDLEFIANKVCQTMTDENEFSVIINNQTQRVLLAPVVEHCLRFKVLFEPSSCANYGICQMCGKFMKTLGELWKWIYLVFLYRQLSDVIILYHKIVQVFPTVSRQQIVLLVLESIFLALLLYFYFRSTITYTAAFIVLLVTEMTEVLFFFRGIKMDLT